MTGLYRDLFRFWRSPRGALDRTGRHGVFPIRANFRRGDSRVLPGPHSRAWSLPRSSATTSMGTKTYQRPEPKPHGGRGRSPEPGLNLAGINRNAIVSNG